MSTTDHTSPEWTVEVTPSGHTYHRIERGPVYASLVTYGDRPPVFATMKAHGATILLAWFDTVAEAKSVAMGRAREIGALAGPPVATEPRGCERDDLRAKLAASQRKLADAERRAADAERDLSVNRAMTKSYAEERELEWQTATDCADPTAAMERRHQYERNTWATNLPDAEGVVALIAIALNVDRSGVAEKFHRRTVAAAKDMEAKLRSAEARLADLDDPTLTVGRALADPRVQDGSHIVEYPEDEIWHQAGVGRENDMHLDDYVRPCRLVPVADACEDPDARGPVGVPAAPKVEPAAKVSEQPVAWGVCYDDGSVAPFDEREDAETFRARSFFPEATVEPLYRGAPPVATPGPVALVVDAPVWTGGDEYATASVGQLHLATEKDGRWSVGAGSPQGGIRSIHRGTAADLASAKAAAFAWACAINGARPAEVASEPTVDTKAGESIAPPTARACDGGHAADALCPVHPIGGGPVSRAPCKAWVERLGLEDVKAARLVSKDGTVLARVWQDDGDSYANWEIAGDEHNTVTEPTFEAAQLAAEDALIALAARITDTIKET